MTPQVALRSVNTKSRETFWAPKAHVTLGIGYELEASWVMDVKQMSTAVLETPPFEAL